MTTITELENAANKEREKADGLRREVEKYRQKIDMNKADNGVSTRYVNEARKCELQAIVHEQAAMELEKEIVNLEAQARHINQRKNEIQHTSQEQIARLEKEERALRG